MRINLFIFNLLLSKKMFSNLNESINFLNTCRQINIQATLFIIPIGLLGHALTMLVHLQKKYRLNSGNFFMLCLAFIDGLFLLVHLFEDTIRTIKDVYPESVFINFILKINIVDQYGILCRLINYLRNILRFISGYIIVAFTLQRLLIVYVPLLNKFKKRASAWFTFLFITVFALSINVWTLFVFDIQKNETTPYCDINRDWSNEYLIANVFYIFIVLIFPIVLIFLCNTLIIVKTNADDKERSVLVMSNRSNANKKLIRQGRKNALKTSNAFEINSFIEKKRIPKTNQLNYSKRLTRILLIISFSYSFLNLPYVIAWFIYFSNLKLEKPEASRKNFLFSMVQLTEILSLLNYGITFYLYCLSGNFFCDQLKQTFIQAFKFFRFNSNSNSNQPLIV